jgi:hypothetical protein
MTNIELSPVESSQIEAIGHDPETNTLAIRFKDYRGGRGALYHYANVTTEDFEVFRGAESIGRHFKTVIKADPEAFPYTRIFERETEDGADE